MTALRRIGYAALLVASIFHYAPSLASAEETARGRFVLMHEVRWGNASVPAGEYEFNYDPNGITPVLTIKKVSGSQEAFMLLVPAREIRADTGSSQIVLESTSAGRYVTAMKLPECGMVLHFNVPRATEKQMARTMTASAAGQ